MVIDYLPHIVYFTTVHHLFCNYKFVLVNLPPLWLASMPFCSVHVIVSEKGFLEKISTLVLSMYNECGSSHCDECLRKRDENQPMGLEVEKLRKNL